MPLRHLLLPLALLFPLAARAQVKDYPLQPAPISSIQLAPSFWASRIDINRTVTLPHNWKQIEDAGEIDNFAKAAGLMPGPHKGWPPRDSDIYKTTEGCAYSLMAHPDPELEKYLDAIIAKVAAAQEPDGYLYTVRRLTPPDQMPAMSGKERWVNERESHETYVMGLLCESGIAYFQATGKRTLLDAALKSANLLEKTFGPADTQRHEPPGHEELEIALAKIYRQTGDARFLKLDQYLIDQRGHHTPSFGSYAQDNIPVADATEAVGHAVRAGYLYAGVTDLVALTGDARYSAAIDRLWKNVVGKKMYLTGGLGARRNGEAFGNDYELPNLTAYNETCAAVASAFWNQRLFLLHPDAQYADVLERILYNAIPAGVSLSGDHFFYTNAMESDGSRTRSLRMPWFTTPCCPTNIGRILPQIPSYALATGPSDIYINLFLPGTATLKLPTGQTVTLTTATQYPWDGQVKFTLASSAPADLTLHVRIPGWARNQPVPSDLYRYSDNTPPVPPWSLTLNGQKQTTLTAGYITIKKTWSTAADNIELTLPMPIHRVQANDAVEADRGRIALERGPLVYCAESADNPFPLQNLTLPPSATFTAEFNPTLLGGITLLHTTATLNPAPATATTATPATTPAQSTPLTLIPYALWSNRTQGQMLVWLPSSP